MAHLTLVVQGREVRKFPLTSDATSIGRAQDNDIVINNLALSRRHAEVLKRGGRFEVSDLGSQNGVYVNNNRISGPEQLHDADTITLGTYHFVFSSDEPGSKKRRREPTELESGASISIEVMAPEPLLILKYNEVELQRFPLTDTECLIGRAKDCHVQIAERRLSRRHCKVFIEDNRYWLADLGSQNGTYVNRRRIPTRYALTHGDVLNFAEYSIFYLADASDYDGPDGDGMPAPRPGSSIEAEETAFPETYGEEDGPMGGFSEPQIVAPSELTQNPEDDDPAPPVHDISRHEEEEPFVEPPQHARERRKKAKKRSVKEPQVTVTPPAFRDPGRSAKLKRTEPKAPPKKASKAKKPRSSRPPVPVNQRPRVEPPQIDVDDVSVEVRPESALKDWYEGREDSNIYREEPSVLLERSKSSMSELLSTMMVDKRDLDRNLQVHAKRRKFAVEVRANGKVIFSGVLKNEVTILGTDDEADIRLVGRYVAGRHSLLVRVRDSLLLVRLGSSSAARVNGLPKLQAFLRSGDMVEIDETTIEIIEE